jgi:hypothetical protein
MIDYPFLLGRLEGSVRAALSVAAVSPGDALHLLAGVGEALKENLLDQLGQRGEDAFLRAELELLESDLRAVYGHLNGCAGPASNVEF